MARLDGGPVRVNSKVIQELEAPFLGAPAGTTALK